MDSFDLVKSLVSLGVDEKSAEMLKAKLRGNDLMGLINALNSDELGLGIQQANEILSKYNVKLGGANQMDDYRNAEMEALKKGDLFAVENFINEWLSPVTNHLAEGFDYAVELSEENRDKVLDWLDEQKIEYMAQTPSVFHIKCEDRAAAYRVSKAMSGMMGRSVVRDSADQEDEIMSEKKSADRRVRDAKDKLANVKDRNLAAAALIGKTGGGAHKGDPRKNDPMGRGAKHKGKFEEGFEDANQDGEVEMSEESDNSRLEEGVMGVTNLQPIFRLKELAGIRSGPVPRIEETDLVPIEDDEPELELDGLDADPMDAGMDMPVDDMGADDMAMDLEPADAMDAALDAPMDAGMDVPADDMGMDMPMDPMGGNEFGDAGVPGDLPPMPIEPVLGGMAPAMAAPTQSEAMMQIEDGLNSIQTMLADIRLSEYKALVIKLQDLTVQVQNMGRDYLGERRKK